MYKGPHQPKACVGAVELSAADSIDCVSDSALCANRLSALFISR